MKRKICSHDGMALKLITSCLQGKCFPDWAVYTFYLWFSLETTCDKCKGKKYTGTRLSLSILLGCISYRFRYVFLLRKSFLKYFVVNHGNWTECPVIIILAKLIQNMVSPVLLSMKKKICMGWTPGIALKWKQLSIKSEKVLFVVVYFLRSKRWLFQYHKKCKYLQVNQSL